jgi:hypothetical protein
MIQGIYFSPLNMFTKFCLWKPLSARCVCYVTLLLAPGGLNLCQIVKNYNLFLFCGLLQVRKHIHVSIVPFFHCWGICGK